MSARPGAALFWPLLSGFRAARRPAARTPRLDAIHAAAAWLHAEFLDRVGDAELRPHLLAFYRAVVPMAWHESALGVSLGKVRFALNHVLHGLDGIDERLARCTEAGGAYRVPGLNSAFWSAVVKATAPARLPDWRPGVTRGLGRLGLSPAKQFGAAAKLYAKVQAEFPDLDADALDEFFSRAATLRGRELGDALPDPTEPTADRVQTALRTLRVAGPLKPRIAAHAERLAATRAGLAAATTPEELLTAAGLSAGRGDATWVTRVTSAGVATELERVGEVELFALLAHVQNPERGPAWCDATRRGAASLSDACDPALPATERFTLACEVVTSLRERFRVHPAEVAPLLGVCAELFAPPEADAHAQPGWAGFCRDTFAFLAELDQNNDTAWMANQRERYNFAVRVPLVELCEELAARYVRPVAGAVLGFEMETEARVGRAITSIYRNDFGRAAAYAPELWITFHRATPGAKRQSAELCVRVNPAGVAFGFHLGPRARAAGKAFRKLVQEHGDKLFRALSTGPALADCRLGDTPDAAGVVANAADLRAWAAGKELYALRYLAADDPAVRRDDLVGEILLTFDRLLPLLAAAAVADPLPFLAERSGAQHARPRYDRRAFRAATHLGETWLSRTLDLLQLKKQLVFQGVPGTGKTHVARQLARLITDDRPGLVRLVQFHPGYSYEEFVEGIRPKSGAQPGETVYAVEPGVLAAFVEQATLAPSEPHVLVIDELNRGNLPRVMGELLFLLEYRDQEVTLPYSKRPFRLPDNLYLLATMNPADQSVGVLDQALRRRFSFVDVEPDAALLAAWLEAHPPAEDDPTFGPRVVQWFDDLNRRLRRDAGPDRLVGHSFLMLPGLTFAQLQAVWTHQIAPVLQGAFPGGADRLEALGPAKLDPSALRKPATR